MATMRWIQFTTNCNSHGHRFKIGDVVQLEYTKAMIFIGGNHARWRLDLELEAERKPHTPLDTALKNVVEKSDALIPPGNDPFGCSGDGIEESVGAQPDPVSAVEPVRRGRGRPPKEKGIRDNWLSIAEVLKICGLKDTKGNQILLKTAGTQGQIVCETREGERPVYQFERESAKAFARKLKRSRTK